MASGGLQRMRMSGYKGRTGVYELMVADDEIRERHPQPCRRGPPGRAAQAAGMKTMRDDGDRLVAEV